MKSLLKIGLIIALLIAGSLLWPVHEWMQAVITFVKASGTWGVVIFAVIYIVATVMLIPASLLTLGAGFIYGPFWGTLLVSPISVMAAFIAYCLARSRLRPWIQSKVQGAAKFGAVDNAVGEKGFKIVLLLRLSPLFPFTILNYALGLTQVKMRSYVLASFIGMLPATFLYTYLGSLVISVSELAGAPDQGAAEAQSIFMWVGFAVTVIVTIYVTRLARKALKEVVGESDEETL